MMKKLLLGAALALGLMLPQGESSAQNFPGLVVFEYNSYTNITTATTTTSKQSAGLLHCITINTYVASATITAYDSKTGSGTKIGTLTLPSTITGLAPTSVCFDVAYYTGLTIVTSGATDITVSYR